MKNFFKEHRDTIIGIVEVILLVASIVLFITGCINRRYYNGSGLYWYLTSCLLIIVLLISNYSDFYDIGFILLYLMFIIFLLVPNHLRPTVTECTPLSTPSDVQIFEMKDTRTFCLPTDSTQHFTLISSDTVISRSSKCAVCKKNYDNHYFRLLTERQLAKSQEEKSILHG